MSASSPDEKKRRILGRVDRSQFIGREPELNRIVAHPQHTGAAGLLVLLAPTAGVSELLRQAYDQLFNQRAQAIPVYFALPPEPRTAVSTAISFLNTFLSQYLAFRRNDPSLCSGSFSLQELLELAPPTDYEWIEQIVESYKRERFSNDDAALIRWCLSVPQKVPREHGRAFVMVDGVVPGNAKGPSPSDELIRVFSHANLPYLIAGLRRQLLHAVHSMHCHLDTFAVLKLERLADDEARALIEQVARRQNVRLSDEVRDLLVQQFEASPFFVTSLINAAHELAVPLTSFLACERLYVDELMGGRLGRYFSTVFEEIAPELTVRRALVRMLYEAGLAADRKVSIEVWKGGLGLAESELEPILRGLHVQELISWEGALINASGRPIAWSDYLETRYRLDISREPRALVVADTITKSLKRAPQTMARYYRRVASVDLRDSLSRFTGQKVPSMLLDYARFSQAYKGLPVQEIDAALEADTELMRLPFVVHVASAAAFNPAAREFCDDERCVVAHAFTDGRYSETSQVVWLAAEIDWKLEADLELTQSWFDWLHSMVIQAGFGSTRIWLIAREGFSPEASAFLNEMKAMGSSRQQFELLTARLSESASVGKEIKAPNEFEMIVPMGADNELIVAHTVEEIARRLQFRPEAINQIKHAVVEAFINASEHSLSPERKIYQRFLIEDDKLVITISSRGILAAPTEARNGGMEADLSGDSDPLASRRGLGLTLIRTLMDEVEFERVDDGTSLRMTKYLRT
jgi:anti-sigma regulatory factor (Ser/Thr protein kinase)